MDHHRSWQSLHPPRAGRFWKFDKRDRTSAQRLHDLGFTLLGAAMAVAVFAVDTFTSIESAVAVLYVVALLLSSDALSRRGILAAAAICVALCLLSYMLTHGTDGDAGAILRLLVSLAALSITAALLLRNDAARWDLLESHAETARSEYRYRSIFEHSRVAIWEQDYSELHSYLESLKQSGVRDIDRYAEEIDGFVARCAAMVTTVAVNNAMVELLGASSPEEVLGPLSKFIPEHGSKFSNVVRAMFDGERGFEAHGTLRTLEGADRTVLAVLTFPKDETALDRVVVALVDITEREQMHAALMAAQVELARASRVSAVGVVSASIAHELHQPLGALTVNAETCLRWLAKDPPNIPAARKAVDRMIRDAERASGIVKSTRALVARQPVGTDIVDVAALVRETVSLLKHDLKRHGVATQITEANRPLRVSIARNELQQVLINLITNATQAMSDAASPVRQIHIRLAKASSGIVQIEVGDTGPGLDETKLNKLFEAFFTTKENGIGMGLAISRSSIEARGGRLTAANNTGMAGACFIVELPPAEALKHDKAAAQKLPAECEVH